MAADDIGDGVFQLLINDPRPVPERLANITARLERVPEYVEQQLAALDVPVKRWVDMDAEKVSGLPQLLSSVRGLAGEAGFADAARLEKACGAADAALKSYVERLRALPTTSEFHLSRADAERVVALRGIEQSFDELRRWARDFLAETEATIGELRGKLAPKYDLPADCSVEQLHETLNQRFKVSLPNGKLEDVLAHYQDERERILAFIRERDLFPVFEQQDINILRTPKFLEPSIPAGAMLPPPPFRDGVRTSLVYLTLSDELLDEHTELSIPGMMIHEGIPGHHLQLATASLHPSVVRRHFDAMEHAEGWTTMLEDYMLDVGYLEDRGLVDEARFIGKRDIARIGARVAIDLYFMTGDVGCLDIGIECDTSSDDPFVNAGRLLKRVTGFTDARVRAELNWYSRERGYPLCYLTGNRLVWKLRREVAEHLKQSGTSQLDADRRFHRLYLESGNMPVRFLRRVAEHEGLLPS